MCQSQLKKQNSSIPPACGKSVDMSSLDSEESGVDICRKVIFRSPKKKEHGYSVEREESGSVARTLGYRSPAVRETNLLIFFTTSLSPQGASAFRAFARSKSGGSPVKLSVSTEACGDLMNLNPTVFRVGK